MSFFSSRLVRQGARPPLRPPATPPLLPFRNRRFPHVAGRAADVLGIAQTGTGKTAAFVLPMADAAGKRAAPRARMPRTLILEPTRELAAQVKEQFDKYGRSARNSTSRCVDRRAFRFGDQDTKLTRGVDVLIATPGRLLDHTERGGLLLTGVELLVIDEADRMLGHGLHSRHRTDLQAGAVHPADAVLHRDHADRNPPHHRNLSCTIPKRSKSPKPASTAGHGDPVASRDRPRAA